MPKSPPAPASDNVTVGATLHKPSGMWVGWVSAPGKPLLQLPPRAARDRALADARAHKERLLHPPVPTRIWRRNKPA